MMEELDGFQLMYDQLREYWLIGESCSYNYWDDDTKLFTDSEILMPEYVDIQGYPLVKGRKNKYEYYLIPSPSMLDFVNNTDPYVQKMVKNLPREVQTACETGEMIRLDPFNVMSLIRKQARYNTRGTSIVLRALKDLLFEDKLRESQYCLMPTTEVMTKTGFKQIVDVTVDDEVACFDKESDDLVYHNPTKALEFDYNGDLVNFKNARTVDFTCTPNHRMLVKRNPSRRDDGSIRKDGRWDVIRADQVKHTQYVKTKVNWNCDICPDTVEIGDKKIDADTFLEFLGYYISEGHTQHKRYYRDDGSVKSHTGYVVSVAQKEGTDKRKKIEACLDKLPYNVGRYQYAMNFCDKDALEYLDDCAGVGSFNKKIPGWVKQLPPDKLEIIIDALMLGDGHITERINGSVSHCYATASKQLADDVQEIVFKCGYFPTIRTYFPTGRLKNTTDMYYVNWNSETKESRRIGFLSHYRDMPSGGKDAISKIPYDGKVYCLQVPTGFFVTRQNGVLSIHGNSIADRHVTPREVWKIGTNEFPADNEMIQDFQELIQDATNRPLFNLVTHHAVNHEYLVGAGKFPNLSSEFDWVEKRVLTALFVNSAITTGQGVTYANASVATRILLSRYVPERAKLEDAWKTNFFTPVAIAHKFFKTTGKGIGDKPFADEDQLDIPDFDWRYKTQLLDDQNYRDLLIRLRDKGIMPVQAILEALGQDPDYIKSFLEKEQGTVFDPLYAKWRESQQTGKPSVTGSMPSKDDEKYIRDLVMRTWEDKRAALRKDWEHSLRNADIDPNKVPVPPDLQMPSDKDYEMLGAKSKDIDEEIESDLRKSPEIKTEKEMDEKQRKLDEEPREFSFTSRGGLRRKRRIIESMYEAKSTQLPPAIISHVTGDNLRHVGDKGFAKDVDKFKEQLELYKNRGGENVKVTKSDKKNSK